MSYLLLTAGLAVLVFTGDLLVRGSVALAERLGVPALIIGLTIVAFGTSAPELVISVQAALAGAPGIALGNVIGSNIANILLVLGLPALIAATTCSQPLVLRNALFMIATTVIFIAMSITGTLVWWHGAILFTMIVGFLAMSARRARIYRNSGPDEIGIDQPEGARSLPIAIVLVLAGLIGLPFGAHLTIESARTIAASWGVTEAAIGLTVVALGTSLPELAANLMAAIRKESTIAIGNIIGSNIFNILAVMGITALVVPVPVPDAMLRFDVWVMLACSLILLPYILARRSIGAGSGVIFIAFYVVYVAIVMAHGGLSGTGG